MYDIFIMDLGGHDDNVCNLLTRFPHAIKVRYYDTHLDTIKRCIARARTSFAWVISSCCDYSDFDFDYRAAPWESYQIHCWASGTEKFGDTFLIPVNEFKQQQDSLDLLEWYKDINWHSPGVPRLSWPVVTSNEHLTRTAKELQFSSPYVCVNQPIAFDPPLWKNRAVYTFNSSGSVSLVPRDIKGHLETQIYDYPYIIKEKTEEFLEKPLDIIYISNNEPNAEQWYNNLVDTVYGNPLRSDTGRVKRIKNVDGRANAYKAAANASSTEWFFAVFAKLEVADDFDWAWQPDWLQEPKHYIFYSLNPVNKLTYGHMGIIAYNRQLVLNTDSYGLDFTLSQAHAVVPVVSGTAHFNTTPELTWRTAFRECVKLKDDVVKTGNVESNYRLKVWTSTAEGQHAEWSIKGAQDAVDYYESVNGNHDQLMLSFEWQWLKEYWTKLHGQV